MRRGFPVAVMRLAAKRAQELLGELGAARIGDAAGLRFGLPKSIAG